MLSPSKAEGGTQKRATFMQVALFCIVVLLFFFRVVDVVVQATALFALHGLTHNEIANIYYVA